MPQIHKLISWFDKNQRNLPWRATNDPYRIWLSEIILQQTRVDQGMSYYLSFIEKYPSLVNLANAPEDEVLKLWQGLGYYSRARNLHKTAKIILSDFQGSFPSSYSDLIKLPGIGPYTAAAISSIAFGRPHPVMDGNVMRVASRWFAIEQPMDTTAGKITVQSILNDLMDKNNPGKFNQAMMEFGATYCVPANPNCPECIFSDRCMAFHSDKVGRLPVKSKKAKIRSRFFNYIVPLVGRGEDVFTLIRKRDGSDIWKGLYEFPLIETTQQMAVNEVFLSDFWIRLTETLQPVILSVSDGVIHLLTHQRIHARFIIAQIDKGDFIEPEKYLRIPLSQLTKYPVSRLTQSFLTKSGLMKVD